MSQQLRLKGKFIKKRVLDKKLQFVAKMNSAKKHKIESKEDLDEENGSCGYVCTGRRIVELLILGKNLKCSMCKKVLSLENIIAERRFGLNSVLSITCDKCPIITLVPTGKLHTTNQLKNHADVNTKAVLGSVHAGVGCTALNKILACLNVPIISSNLFKRYEREIGPAIEERAKESCKLAAKEERQLVIANIEKLCRELPQEIADKIYPQKKILNLPEVGNLDESSLNSTGIDNGTKIFDAALGNIINIIVSYDMGWSKRGNGRSYNSLNGYATIIGFLTSKVLDFTTQNRKCRLCDRGHDKSDHDCRKNFEGSAKAMEPDAGASLVNESDILNNNDIQVRVLIGDEDSSTIANVRRGTEKEIFKFADTNHLKKHFVGDLYNIQKNYKEMKKKGTIAHLKKCFNYAIQQNKGKPEQLAFNLRSIPHHVFGQHENCGTWCTRKSLNHNKSQTILLKDNELYNQLLKIFNKYADNAAKFAVGASSQANESINNTMAHKAPKNMCYSLSESADYRFASTVCSKNEGEKHLLHVTDILNISPGKYTAAFAIKKDEERERRAIKAKLPLFKSRRNFLFTNKENLRKKNEKKEGIQYKSNCGMEIDRPELDISRDLKELEDAQHTFISEKDLTIVYFDIETSGFEKNANILQIAAKFNNNKFNVYIKPTKDIHPCATQVTGLRQINGILYLKNCKLDCVTFNEALNMFNNFLKKSLKPCILVAHNVKFDAGHLVRAIIKHSMILAFQNIVGFVDTLAIFKEMFSERKDLEGFKLSKLANDMLVDDISQKTKNFHEAMYDVEVLEKLALKFIPQEYLLKPKKLFIEYLRQEHNYYKAALILPSLKILEKTISKNMIKKIADAGINFTMLLDANKEEKLVELLSETKTDMKPRVTKNKKILHNIFVFINKQNDALQQ